MALSSDWTLKFIWLTWWVRLAERIPMTDTEAALIDWRNEDRSTEDDLYEQFCGFAKTFAGRNWCAISDEARRVHNLMFDDDVEDGSPLDSFYAAVAAAAAHGAFAAVAAALDVDAESLEHAMAEWYFDDETGDPQETPPPALTPEEFMAKVAEAHQWLQDLKAGKSDKKQEADHESQSPPPLDAAP